MGRIRTIARRTFLTGSAAVLGGVAFGTYLGVRPNENPLAADLDAGEVAFNPWVMITGDEITLVVPHADKGQGVVTPQAALIAEELDVELDQVTLSFGQPSVAYYNTAFADEGVPFMSFDDSGAAETMRSIMGGVIKIFGIQGTGGSTTMPDSFDKLRHAGAVARETLKLAASARSGVDVAQMKTQAGQVILPDGTAIPYTDLAAEAAGIKPVSYVELRDSAEWRLIGKPMARLDMVGKSTGTLKFGIDQSVDGMVHASLRMNPRKGGGMNGYDASAAEAMRGVSKVVEITNGVAVVADNTWRAIEAANAIEIDWGAAPYPAEQAEHWQVLSDSFVPERVDSEWRHDGDVDTGLTSGTATEAEYRAPYVAHAPLEPISAIVRVAEDGASVEVWCGHQMQLFLQQQVAGVVGCEPSAVTLHNQYIGGSFGHRLEFENVIKASEIANQMRGTPVKLTFSREEDMAQDFTRQIAMSRSKGTVEGGQVKAWDLGIAMPSVIASQMGRIGIAAPGPDAQIVAGAWNMPYDIENLRVTAYRAPELAPISSWRSVGASTAGFFAEGFLDELIHAAGADPLEERLRLVNHDVHRKVLEAAGEISNWGSDLGPNRGRGIALVESFGVPVAEVAEVTATDSGIKVDKVYVVVDVGRVIDPVNLEAQVQGGVIWGMGHAMNAEITYADGMAEQSNYHDHEGMRLYQTPEIVVQVLENAPKIRGIGEPAVPAAAPALANAIFAATGTRLREMPFNKFVDFV
ncbi:MAG: molybdopterin-dependent oxidoreductase [Silicimonas sp.]|nr:molybdopterin-dependent oxidoreductase [Silicimonas sp.]